MPTPVTFYTDALVYINGVCDAYVGANVAAVARVVGPFLTSMLGIYFLMWSMAGLLGAIRDPFPDFVKRFCTLAAVLVVGYNVAVYNTLITDTFLRGPDELIAGLARSPSASGVVSGLDAMFAQGVELTGRYWAKAGILDGDFGMYAVASAVMFETIVVTAYSFFLIALSKVMLTCLIGLGPLFFIGLLFQPTAGFFNAWLRQMANYFLVPVLVIMVNLLVMTLFARAGTGAAAITSTTEVAQVFPFLAMGLICLLALASVMGVAGGLAGGVSMSSFGMGRFTGSLLRHGVGKLAGTAAPPMLNGGKKVARVGWNAYQNRQRNSIARKSASAPRPAIAAGPEAMSYDPD
jgi:type IV secretion system protein VirB6